MTGTPRPTLQQLVDQVLTAPAGARIAALEVEADRWTYPLPEALSLYVAIVAGIALDAKLPIMDVIEEHCDGRSDLTRDSLTLVAECIADDVSALPSAEHEKVIHESVRGDMRLCDAVRRLLLDREHRRDRDHRQPTSGCGVKTVIGDLTLVCQVGKGGFGSVWKARKSTGEYAAIKFLKSSDPRAVRQFVVECVLLKDMWHPHVAGYQCHGEDHELGHFLVMRWIEGKTLTESSKDLTTASKIMLFRDGLHGVQALHDRAIYHGDIKPQNILVDVAYHRVKIVDLGSAWHAGVGDSSPTGTRAYMTLDRAVGNEPTEHSDLYGCGMVLFELVTGHLPSGGERIPVDIMQPRRAAERLADIVAFALRHGDDDGYRTVRALATDLEWWLADYFIQDLSHAARRGVGRRLKSVPPEWSIRLKRAQRRECLFRALRLAILRRRRPRRWWKSTMLMFCIITVIGVTVAGVLWFVRPDACRWVGVGWMLSVYLILDRKK